MRTDDDVRDALLELGKVSSDSDSCDDQTGCVRDTRAPAGWGVRLGLGQCISGGGYMV